MQKIRASCSTGLERAHRSKPLSIEKIRRYRGLENLSDTEAKQAVDGAVKLSILLFQLLKNSEINCYENDITSD